MSTCTPARTRSAGCLDALDSTSAVYLAATAMTSFKTPTRPTLPSSTSPLVPYQSKIYQRPFLVPHNSGPGRVVYRFEGYKVLQKNFVLVSAS
jgi:hypothetical protein